MPCIETTSTIALDAETANLALWRNVTRCAWGDLRRPCP